MKDRILVIDNEDNTRATLKTALTNKGYEVITAKDFTDVLSGVNELDFDVILANIVLKKDRGNEIVREAREKNVHCPIAFITGERDGENVYNTLRLDAFGPAIKPATKNILLSVARVALQQKALVDEKEKYRLCIEAICKSIKDAIITVDNGMLVIEISKATRDICDFSRDVIGKPLKSLSQSCNGRCLDVLEETIQKKKSIEIYRSHCKHEQRHRQIVNIRSYPVMEKGTVSGAVLVVRDETMLAHLEQDLSERQQFHTIIGKSEKMQTIYSLIEGLTDVQSPVMITGETGTGKELAAEALHYTGKHKNNPFVKMNCTALSENAFDVELFGYVKGAFIGAVQDRIGKLQMAHGGTIFLDEIGDISSRMQLQLMKLLQEKEFVQIGGPASIKLDARVVVSTNQDIKEKVRRGAFREDLYYSLKAAEIDLPPLRNRREDIVLLVNHFLKEFNKRFNKNLAAISPEVQKIFMNYSWPGNIRELENIMEHAFILCRNKIITVNHLPSDLKDFTVTNSNSFKEQMSHEPRTILTALEKTAWNKVKAARLLNMSRSTFYRKIEEYKIKTKKS